MPNLSKEGKLQNLDSGLGWTMDWTQLWTHKEDAETVFFFFFELN